MTIFEQLNELDDLEKRNELKKLFKNFINVIDDEGVERTEGVFNDNDNDHKFKSIVEFLIECINELVDEREKDLENEPLHLGVVADDVNSVAESQQSVEAEFARIIANVANLTTPASCTGTRIKNY